MSKIVDRLFRRLSDRRQDKRDKTMSEVHRAIIILADDSAGRNGGLDLDFYADLVEREGFTEADLRKNIEVYRQRCKWAKLAGQREALKKAAEQAERDFNDFDLAEGRRRLAAQKKLQALEHAVPIAVSLASKSLAAEGNLLAQAARTPEERALNEESGKLNETLGRLRRAVDATYSSTDAIGHSTNLAGDWASIQEFPALLCVQTRRKLKDEADVLSDDRKTQLKSQLLSAEGALADRSRELVVAERKAVEMKKKLLELNAAKMLPESFRIIRAKPTHDEDARRRAYELGYHGGSGIEIKAGK